MPGLRFQHFSVAVSQGKKISLKKCSMFLADESVVLTQIRRVFLDALQADANPRIHKAGCIPALGRKPAKICRASLPAAQRELLLRAGSGGRALAGDSLRSCRDVPRGHRAVPPVALCGKLRLLGSQSACPRSAGFGVQTGLGSSVVAAVARRPALPACSRHHASTLPVFRPRNLGIPEKPVC